MQSVKVQTEKWLLETDPKNNSVAIIMFACEEIDHHFIDYSDGDIHYIVDRVIPRFCDLIEPDLFPDEVVLIVASTLTKMRPYVVDDETRHKIFILSSKLILKFLKTPKKARAIADLMMAYQREREK